MSMTHLEPTHARHRCFAFASVCLGFGLFAAPIASAATFTEGFVANGSSTEAVGQSFASGIAPTPDPGLAGGAAVYLTDVAFASGGAGVGDAATYLAIVAGAFYDFNGDPDGSYVPTNTSPGILGVSSNAIDTVSAGYGDPLSFSFGSGIAMNYGDVVSAVFVTVNGSNEITPMAASVAFIEYVETDPGSGIWAPVSNYGTTGNFDATALFADSDGDGYLAGSTDATDLSFQATFSDVPEPASLMLLVAGACGLACRRRGDRDSIR